MKRATPPAAGADDAREDAVDWSVTSFQGARREQVRRWAALPLEDVLDALEEMQRLADALGEDRDPPAS